MFKTIFLSLSLNKKLIFMMLFLSSILLVFLFFLYWQSEKALMNELGNQTAELSKAIQVGVEEVTGSGATDESRLAQYLKNLTSKGINEISIISNTDEIIASTNPTKIGAPLTPKKKELIIKAEVGEPVSKEGRAYNVIVPVIAGGAHYGYIHLKINADDVSQVLKQNFVKRIFAALLVFAIGTGIAIFLSLRYTEPIHEVVDAARKVAAGDLDLNLPVDRKDEIGELTESFNFMVQRLRENKRLEERLREAEHLSAVGQLSRSIAHEIRNPLNFISLSIDHIGTKYRPEQDDVAKDFVTLVSGIKHEIHRLNKLVTDFLDYGRPLKLNLRRMPINPLLHDIVGIIKAKADSERVVIDEDCAFSPDVTIDPELIKTCIMNVVLNAFQAMPEGGTLRIRTGRDNGKFFLSVSDTGKGVPRENLSRIFEPFYTTKSDGLGLGLATTKRIIEEHQGKIDFQSGEGKGSTVMITLPLS
ncbi:MAG TPA: ATP-binding protein [Thermodesulfovibrionales bacterium]|nr:ATP-binding protein [Thermodesulfovibrionales bacterium]